MNMAPTLVQMTRKRKERVSVQLGTSLKDVVAGDVLYDPYRHMNLLVTSISPYHVNLIGRGLADSPIMRETHVLDESIYTAKVSHSQALDHLSSDILNVEFYRTANQFLNERGL